jgi:hypothetical protein
MGHSAIGERGNSLLNMTFKAPRNISPSPWHNRRRSQPLAHGLDVGAMQRGDRVRADARTGEQSPGAGRSRVSSGRSVRYVTLSAARTLVSAHLETLATELVTTIDRCWR